MQASAPWTARAVAEPVCRICGARAGAGSDVHRGASYVWSNSIASARLAVGTCPLCRGRAPSVPARPVTPRAPVMLRMSSANTLQPVNVVNQGAYGSVRARASTGSLNTSSVASVSNWAVVRPASAVPWQTCVPGMSAPQELAAARGHCLGMESSAKSDSRSSPPVIQAAVMGKISPATGPVQAGPVQAGGGGASRCKEAGAPQSSWRSEEEDSKTRTQSAASTAELPSRELKGSAMESAVLLSEFGKTLEQASLLLRQGKVDSDAPANPGQDSPASRSASTASAAGPLPPPHSAVPLTRLMAAAVPQLPPDWPTPVSTHSPPRASEAPAKSSLLAQQSARRSPSDTARTLDPPNGDSGPAVETSTATLLDGQESTTDPPAIKFPEPSLPAAVGSMSTLVGSTATPHNPMLASAPTLPCTPMSDATPPLVADRHRDRAALQTNFNNFKEVMCPDASFRSTPFGLQGLQGKMMSLPGVSSSRSPSRPRSPPKHEELYEDAAARRERHQDRLGEQMRRQQQIEAEEQMRWQLERERWQASYKGPQDLRSHLERELELLQKRRSRQHEFQVEQLAREKQEMQECTFWPNTSRSKTSYEAVRAGSRSRNSVSSISGVNGSSSSVSVRAESRRGVASRSSSRGQSPRDERIEELLALHEKQVMVLSRLSQICAGHGGASPRCTTTSSLSGLEEVKLYIQQLRQVHELERLDMQVLELPKRRQQTLMGLGYKFGLAKDLRAKLPSPHIAGAVTSEVAGLTSATGAAKTDMEPPRRSPDSENKLEDELLSASSPT
ncbi:unnamed protein product [Symbiodinium natans]|uniref:Uncharacterized protein n=1 Tax=Symbiodinium natans TaxID=878477 RepID=A0A812VAS7_9DINO|nr:unnamed protein product [Symbiodinium natans]